MNANAQSLYFLFDRNQPNLKIGIAKNVLSRLRTLPEEIDLDRSLYVECSKQAARKIEQTIHTVFAEHSIAKDRGDGYTEWFDSACFDDVRNFLETHRDRLGCSDFRAIPKPLLLLPDPKPAEKPPTTAQRLTREEVEERNILALKDTDERCLEALNEIEAIIQSGACVGRMILKIPDFFFGNGRKAGAWWVFNITPETHAIFGGKVAYDKMDITLCQYGRCRMERLFYVMDRYTLTSKGAFLITFKLPEFRTFSAESVPSALRLRDVLLSVPFVETDKAIEQVADF